MVKLADDVTDQQWEDFKKFLIQMGFLREDPNHPNNLVNGNLAQLAFKQGFVAGAQHAQQPPQKASRKLLNGRKIRTGVDREIDNRELARLLREYDAPVALSTILQHMLSEKRTHWNTNNASSFVKTAIKDGVNISKVATGVYQYDREVDE